GLRLYLLCGPRLRGNPGIDPGPKVRHGRGQRAQRLVERRQERASGRAEELRRRPRHGGRGGARTRGDPLRQALHASLAERRDTARVRGRPAVLDLGSRRPQGGDREPGRGRRGERQRFRRRSGYRRRGLQDERLDHRQPLRPGGARIPGAGGPDGRWRLPRRPPALHGLPRDRLRRRLLDRLGPQRPERRPRRRDQRRHRRRAPALPRRQRRADGRRRGELRRHHRQRRRGARVGRGRRGRPQHGRRAPVQERHRCPHRAQGYGDRRDRGLYPGRPGRRGRDDHRGRARRVREDPGEQHPQRLGHLWPV
ncbi:MAG: ATPase involved in DNA repair, partial [uncultured Rubrobacteraceae bacterium]